MASKPPSGASRFPEILSFWSSWVNSLTLLVNLMTFLKANGGSLLGHGCLSLTKRMEKRQRGNYVLTMLMHVQTVLNFLHFFLLDGPHVSLGLYHFVHKLSKSNSVVIRQLLHQRSYRKYIPSQYNIDTHQDTSPLQGCSPKSFPMFFKLVKSSSMEFEKSIRI